MNATPIVIHWFRRDLRLDDNSALTAALNSGLPVMPVFIFDTAILNKLVIRVDRRITFIADRLAALQEKIRELGGALRVFQGKPDEILTALIAEFNIRTIFCNEDYEPYARERDGKVQDTCAARQVGFSCVKDHVIYSPQEILKDDGTPYQVFTPFSRRWMYQFEQYPPVVQSELPRGHFLQDNNTAMVVSPETLGFSRHTGKFPDASIVPSIISHYAETRDYPAIQGTTHLGLHLRFGTISIRKLALRAYELNQKFLSELIWREFYQMILWHFPHTVDKPFRAKYNNLVFPGSDADFQKWCRGETGFPLVDAGMHELVETGFMHNRVRMVTASFLTKHLLCDWRWGERFFAAHLLDFELASNVGGWQWSAGIGADAAPYFRIFNPTEQQKRFDPHGEYVARWAGSSGNLFGQPELLPMVDHRFARERCLEFFSAVRQ